MNAPLPKIIDSYEILEEVGIGGLGRVFKGLDRKNGRFVAIKMLHDRLAQSRKFLGIFHRELLIISRLHHKNIVSYLDGRYDYPSCYIVTEFVDGCSVHALMKRFGRLPPLVAMSLAMEYLQGVDYLHLHDTIHADLSSPNVLISLDGRVLVTDFGLAAEQNIEDYKGYMIGTPGYYAPEHITEASIVPQTDVYCAALILFELLSGAKAVPASNDRKATLYAMKRIDFTKIRCEHWRMQGLLRKLLKKALHFSPSRRIQTAEEFMYGLYQILKRYGIRYTRHAVWQYIHDRGMTQGFRGHQQDIYKGYIP